MPNAELSAMETARANSGQFTGFQIDRAPKPERFIYIYSVAKKDYPAGNGLIRTTLKGCHNGERYVECAEIPDPFHESIDNLDNGRKMPSYTDGIFVSMDLINPVNFTGNQDMDTSQFDTGDGMNLNVFGIFWSTNKPPTEVEIAAAERRVLKRKQTLADKVLQVARSSPKDLQFVLNEESRQALDDLGIETDFHKRPTERVTCPNCGEMISAKASFHRNKDLDIICVLPTSEAWRAAVASGARKVDDVPEQFRDKRGPGRPPSQ